MSIIMNGKFISTEEAYELNTRSKKDNGIYRGILAPCFAATITKDGKPYTYFLRQDEGLALFEPDTEELADLLYDNQDLCEFYMLNNCENAEVIREAVYNIKLPFDSKPFEHLNYKECEEQIKSTPHVNLYFTDEFWEPSKYYSGWVLVELPREIYGVHYVPIIIHNYDGVSVHPDFHKHFLQAFNKKERHVILGYCYLHGNTVIRHINYAIQGHRELGPQDFDMLQYETYKHKDSDAPKRINSGPLLRKTKFGPELTSRKNYEEYLKFIKSTR